MAVIGIESFQSSQAVQQQCLHFLAQIGPGSEKEIGSGNIN
jgi:hypothetical protein